MAGSAPFFAECPNCGTDRAQPGYDPDELRQLLASGSEIMAYCGSCDEEWAVSIEERADMSRSLGKPRPL